MRLLLLAAEPVSAAEIRAALGDADPAQTEVKVVAPALHTSGLRFWLSDADEAIVHAENVRDQTVANLSGEPGTVHGDTGESDPTQAIEDALVDFAADRILIVPGRSDRYREEDFDRQELSERFGVPVEVRASG